MSNLYFIPLGDPYLSIIAKGIVHRFDNTIRPHAQILLPSNRSVIEFQYAFSKNFPNHIFPQTKTFLDFAQEIIQHNSPMDTQKSFPNFDRLFFVIENLKKIYPLSPFSNVEKIAQTITTLWDEITLSGKTKKNLLHVLNMEKNPSDLQKVFFLVTKNFQAFLESEHLLDETEKKYWIFQKALPLFKENILKQKHPIILAGTTGTIPIIREYASVLLDYSQGFVVLPGLYKVHENLSCYHPLFTQNEWIKNIQNPHQKIKPFYENLEENEPILPIFNNEITYQKKITERFLAFEVNSLEQEARLISLLIRYHLEKTPEKNITIVSGNPLLSNQIQEKFSKYGFQANDSLTKTLLETPSGQFLKLFLQLIQKESLKNIISFLKHPFYQANNRISHLAKLDAFEKYIFQDDLFTIQNILSEFEELKKAIEIMKQPKNFKDFCQLLYSKLDKLSNDSLSQSQDGEELKKNLFFLEKLPLQNKKNNEWVDWILLSISSTSIIMQKNYHQKVKIIGTLEARHQTSDIVIIAGLNEGYWPPRISHNQWLLPEQQKLLNLPENSRRISLNSHDFCNCLTAEHVYLTRSIKEGASLKEKSRLLERLFFYFEPSKTLLDFKDWILNILYYTPITAINKNVENPIYPFNIKNPFKISISALELLHKDPLAFFIKYILNIKERNSWFEDFSNLNLGQIIHKLLEKIDFLNPPKTELIIKKIQNYLQNFSLEDHQKNILSIQMLNMILFVIKQTDSKNLTHSKKEVMLTYQLKNNMIYGIADRIDFYNDHVHLIDYKTGTPPTMNQIKKNESFQMPLLYGMLAQNNHCQIKTSYWKLSGQTQKSKIIDLQITNDLYLEKIDFIEKILSETPWSYSE